MDSKTRKLIEDLDMDYPIEDLIGDVPAQAAETLVRVLGGLDERWTPIRNGLPQSESDAIDRLVRCGFATMRENAIVEMQGRPDKFCCVVSVSGDHQPDDILRTFCSVAPFDWLSADGIPLGEIRSEITSRTICLTLDGVEAKANIVAGDEW